MLKCQNCGYYWQEDWEDYPTCKWSKFGLAPCEEEDEEMEIEEEDE